MGKVFPEMDFVKRAVLTFSLSTAFCLTSSSAKAELLGAWSFDESDGDRVVDGSRYHHDGAVNGVPKYVAGISGDALFFDGVENFVDFGGQEADSPLSLRETSFTITFWIKPEHLEGVQRIINKDSAENFEGGYSIYSEDGMLKVTTNDGKSHNANVIALPPGAWRFIGLVYDQSTGDRKIYINGELVASENVGKDGLKSRRGDPLLLGSIPKYDQRFSGAIDELRFYNEALSGTQIAELIEDPEKDSGKN